MVHFGILVFYSVLAPILPSKTLKYKLRNNLFCIGVVCLYSRSMACIHVVSDLLSCLDCHIWKVADNNNKTIQVVGPSYHIA